jgi:hypothetical protein
MLQLPRRLSGERPCIHAEMLPARGLPRARCPTSIFLQFFKKNPDIYVVTDRTSERFLAEGSTLREVKMMAYVGHKVAAHSKFLAPTPPRLWCKDLRAQLKSSGLHPTSFQKRLSSLPDSGLKRFSQQIRELLLEPPKCSGDVNVWHPLVVREG